MVLNGKINLLLLCSLDRDLDYIVNSNSLCNASNVFILIKFQLSYLLFEKSHCRKLPLLLLYSISLKKEAIFLHTFLNRIRKYMVCGFWPVLFS